VGAFARTSADDNALVLSNNHVLANENDSNIGDPILQPGVTDGGQAEDRIGSLAFYVPLNPTGVNRMDCAVAVIDSDVEYEARELRNIGILEDLAPNDELPANDLVEKIGRTTGHTVGRVTAFELDNVVVGYDLGEIRFDGQIEIEGTGEAPFSTGGDSGSLIFTSEGHRPWALLFAGSERGGQNAQGLTFASPLRPALQAMHVSLIR
jgi:hypothetical protein